MLKCAGNVVDDCCRCRIKRVRYAVTGEFLAVQINTKIGLGDGEAFSPLQLPMSTMSNS